MRRMLPMVLGSLLLAACQRQADSGTPPPPPPPDVANPAVQAAMADPMDAILAGDWRSEKNKARDVYRHPRETLAFFGVGRGQRVLELWPGGGWYSEILAPLEREQGSYVAVVPAAKSDDERRNSGLRALFTAHPAQFDRAEWLEVDPAAPVLGPANSADVVLTFRNVHNWVMAGQAEAMFKAVFAVLRPGGTFGVVDHRARAGAPPAEMKTSGYLPEDYVIGLAKAAGFELADQSEINANPKDTKDYADGVWTLPPTLTKKDQDRDKYLAIGESDRMTLKFVKPAQ